MTNITQTIWNLISQDPSVQKNLQKNLINIRALAKYLINQHGLKASIDSVISAIRRYPTSKNFKENVSELREVFVGANIATKNNLACMVLRNQSDIQKYLSEITKLTDFEKRETLRMIKGKNNLKVITDMVSIQKLKNIFPKEENIEVKENLSEIRILTQDIKADKTKGVAARISNELLTNDININELIFCVPEIIVYVDQKDLLKAHESILQLCRSG
jgi:aspartokinase